MTDPFPDMVGKAVVIDTDGPIVYLGTLAEVSPSAFTLVEADVHDCRDGHATKEVYVAECRRNGLAVNRKKVVVLRRYVMSMSLMDDVAAD